MGGAAGRLPAMVLPRPATQYPAPRTPDTDALATRGGSPRRGGDGEAQPRRFGAALEGAQGPVPRMHRRRAHQRDAMRGAAHGVGARTAALPAPWVARVTVIFVMSDVTRGLTHARNTAGHGAPGPASEYGGGERATGDAARSTGRCGRRAWALRRRALHWHRRVLLQIALGPVRQQLAARTAQVCRARHCRRCDVAPID